MEETFDVFLENFQEFEESLLKVALNQLVHAPHWEREVLLEDRRTVTRRLMNVLTAAQSYLQQVKKDLAIVCTRDPSWRGPWHKAISNLNENSFSYRAMGALRNYVQHHNIFVGAISFPGDWIEESPDNPIGKLRFRVVPSIDVARLEGDDNFSAAVLAELKAEAVKHKDGAIPLAPLLRQYVEGLGKGHIVLRAALAMGVKTWEAQLESIETKAASQLEGSLHGLAIVAIHVESQRRELHYLMHEELSTYRHDLESRNSLFEKFSRRFVSGEQ